MGTSNTVTRKHTHSVTHKHSILLEERAREREKVCAFFTRPPLSLERVECNRKKEYHHWRRNEHERKKEGGRDGDIQVKAACVVVYGCLCLCLFRYDRKYPQPLLPMICPKLTNASRI